MNSPQKRLEKLLREGGLTQTALAARTGLALPQINRWVSGERDNVTPLACLLFAGVATAAEDRAYWLELSEVGGEQLEVIAVALGADRKQAAPFPGRWAAILARALASKDRTLIDSVTQPLILAERLMNAESAAPAHKLKKA